MLLKVGERVHIVERRLLPDDVRRHFIGAVEAVEGACFRASGASMIYDPGRNTWERRREKRTRLFSIHSNALIIHVLPPDASIPHIKYVEDKSGHLVATDEKTFSLDINEFGTTH